jgi:hypothetical protein
MTKLDPVRQEELRIQALGAAISRRDWHSTENAFIAIRDHFDRSRAARVAGEQARTDGEKA